MINLLPSDVRKSLSYARKNSLLMRWAIILSCGLLGTLIVVGAGQFYIHQQINLYKKDIQTTQDQLKEQKIDQTQAKVKEMSGNIKLAVQVLSKQVLFSELIRQIGAAMPPGAALSSLDIGKLQGGINLNAISKDYKTGTQIQVNLQDPANKIFAKADIQSITCNKSSDPVYPCQVVIRALFAADNPFLLVKQKATK